MSGTSPDERLVEVIELEDHPFFVASQFHPEFKSRPERPAPLFREFIAAALERGGDEQSRQTPRSTQPPGRSRGHAICRARRARRRAVTLGRRAVAASARSSAAT